MWAAACKQPDDESKQKEAIELNVAAKQRAKARAIEWNADAGGDERGQRVVGELLGCIREATILDRRRRWCWLSLVRLVFGAYWRQKRIDVAQAQIAAALALLALLPQFVGDKAECELPNAVHKRHVLKVALRERLRDKRSGSKQKQPG